MTEKEIPVEWWDKQTSRADPLKKWLSPRTLDEPANWVPKNSTEAAKAQALHQNGGPIRKTDSNEWTTKSKCMGLSPEIMSPHNRDKVANKVAIEFAKSICNSCVVINECLEATMSDPAQTGVMGGMTAQERKILRAEG